MKQIFEDGFFHGDPHPANIFVIPPATIAMLDVGQVGYVDENMIKNGAKLLKAMIDKNLDQGIRSLEALGVFKKEFDENILRQDFAELIECYVGISLKDLDISKLMQDTVRVMVHNNLVLPSNLALMIKALSMVETTGRQLDPDFNMVTVAKPFINKLLSKKFATKELLKRSNEFIQDSIELIEQLPRDLRDALKKLRGGKLKFIFVHRGLEKLTSEIDRSTSRMSLSIIIAAIIIGSSLIVHVNIGPFIFGYPILGIIGYIIAILLGFGLIISIIRSGKWR